MPGIGGQDDRNGGSACSGIYIIMDRQQMIKKLEQIRSGNQVALEENVSLYMRDGKFYSGAKEVPFENLSRYKYAVQIMIVEDADPELVKIIEEEVCPDLIINEIRYKGENKQL